MKILLVNVDCKFNLAIRKIYNYYIEENEVDMIDLNFKCYPHNNEKTIDASEYDMVFVSNIFNINKDRVKIMNCDNVQFGGIGSRNPELRLPEEIEKTEPFYYPEEDTSYGFIARGCIRNCWFCKVPKYEGTLKKDTDIEKIVKHKKVKFLDNNILAYPNHMEVFKWLIEHPWIKVEFNQGLDFRLINEENAEALSKLNYMGEYIFAFDDPKYKPLLEKKLKIIKKYIKRPWKLKFYVYYHPKMELRQLIERVEWCRENECLPYIMRDVACWEAESDIRNFIIDYAAYCNQPGFFKKMTFEQFLLKRHTKSERIKCSMKIYEEA